MKSDTAVNANINLACRGKNSSICRIFQSPRKTSCTMHGARRNNSPHQRSNKTNSNRISSMRGYRFVREAMFIYSDNDVEVQRVLSFFLNSFVRCCHRHCWDTFFLTLGLFDPGRETELSLSASRSCGGGS